MEVCVHLRQRQATADERRFTRMGFPLNSVQDIRVAVNVVVPTMVPSDFI
jgi:hypothetical protein